MNFLKIVLLFSLLYTPAYAADPMIKITEEQAKSLGVVMGSLEPASEVPLLYAPATVTIPPSHEHIVSSAQPGLITKMTAAVGDNVKKGALLAQINSPALLSLQGQYLKAGSALQLATATYNRDKKLLKDGVIASRREQETLAQYRAALLEANEARQLLEIAGMNKAAIEQLSGNQRLNGEFSIAAPITGVVIEKLAVTGARIDSMTPLYRIANLSELWLEIAIPQERIHDIKLGDQVLIENTQIKATINLIGQSVNPVNQAVMTRALIKGQPKGIRVGQKASIRVVQSSGKALFKVSNTAIAQNEGNAYIFVRTPNGFKATPVQVSGKEDSQSLISGDLSGQEDIAVKGAVALKANWLGLGSDQ